MNQYNYMSKQTSMHHRETISLPSELWQIIDSYYHPYQEQFRRCILQPLEIWKRAWWFWYHQQTPVVQFVMDYLFVEWGIIDDDDDNVSSYRKTHWFPTNLTVHVLPQKDKTNIRLTYDADEDSNWTMFRGNVYNTFQYHDTEDDDQRGSDPSAYTTVYWNDEYWLEHQH